MNREIFFDFFGFRVAVKGSNAEILEDVDRDFSYFSAGMAKAHAQLELVGDHCPRDLLPQVKASLHSPRNIVYRDGDVSYIDYFGRALTVCWARKGGTGFSAPTGTSLTRLLSSPSFLRWGRALMPWIGTECTPWGLKQVGGPF